MLFPGKSYRGMLPPLTTDETACAERMRSDVRMLAETIGERNTRKLLALTAAERFITQRLEQMGYSPVSESFDANGVAVENVIAEVAGTGRAGEIIVIGAHYDSAPGTPGANDNASAVAGLLELAREFKDSRPARAIRLVAFANEEPPYSFTDLMGSRVHASGARKRKEKIVAMLCLECLGVYSDVPGSQKYPPPLERFYPDTADFITFCSNLYSYSLLRKCIKEFRTTTRFPSEGLAAPASVKGVSWSDHWSFWQERYPAIMITDTAFFRYSHYHLPSDTPDRLDYERIARVIGGVRRVVERLCR